MPDWSLINANVVDWANQYNGEKFHAILCDPPYGLKFMGKAWDSPENVAFHKETWEAISKVMYPGALVIAFSSTRTWHRLAVAMEDAGLVMHPTIMNWCFSSGFPKAARIDTYIDAQAGVQQRVVGIASDGSGRRNIKNAENGYRPNPYSEGDTYEVTEPVTELAQEWFGHRYGRQALKPAVEPILVSQVPYPKKVKPLNSMIETGAGAYNIDDCRVKGAKGNGVWGTNQVNCQSAFNASKNNSSYRTVQNNKGRWPANFLLQHTPDCRYLGKLPVEPDGESDELVDTWDCTSECPVTRLNDQSGEMSPKDGGAARYFYQSDWSLEVEERLEMADPVFYCPKASQRERNDGLEKRNPHNTVKPIKLAKYLATLLLPPKRYAPRRILVPFAGSGSEMIGAMLAGWEQIVGVEITPEYIPVAEARLRYWETKK